MWNEPATGMRPPVSQSVAGDMGNHEQWSFVAHDSPFYEAVEDRHEADGAVAAKKAFPKERDKPSVDARWVKKEGLESGFS